ncbi:hypothetical protein LCGC14_2405830 [marine sediment metagenome]|uniref:Uncharacterized protein n=1 Tax=marine sediment metagenome TaxID=412755 RepID=A0A0F9E6A4_9ZZZZ|nr:hypothetical protein [Desulfobacterales bacterium]
MEDYKKVILHPEVSLDAWLLCEQLEIQAEKVSVGSGIVDTIEWEAAKVIRQLLQERVDWQNDKGEGLNDNTISDL